jgi:malate permease and related proteins
VIEEVLTVVTPVFVIAGIGYVWIKRAQPFDNDTIGTLVMYIGSPCLIYSSLTTNAPSLEVLGQMALSALFVIICGVVVALVFLKATGWSFRTYLPALVHPNGGNMGLPVVLLAFGETGLALGMAYFFVNSISQYTLGLAVSSGHFHPKQVLRQPVIWAVLLVVLVLATGTTMPRWFNATTSILGGLTIPAMLLMLGVSLARLNISSVSETLTVAVLRLLLGLALGLTAIWLLDLQGVMAGVVLLQATMPSAVFNYVFAERYNREPDKVAAVILQSTLLSVLTLPALVAWALTF